MSEFTREQMIVGNEVIAKLLAAIARRGHDLPTEEDNDAYSLMLRPLAKHAAKLSSATCPEYWQVYFAIGNCKKDGYEFRPTFEEVQGFVNKALKITIASGAEIDARRPVALLRAEYGEANHSAKQIAGSPVLTSREKAKAMVARLANREVGNKCETAQQAIEYRAPGEMFDTPLSKIPADQQEYYCKKAMEHIAETHGGKHPRNVQMIAVRLWTGAMAKISADGSSAETAGAL